MRLTEFTLPKNKWEVISSNNDKQEMSSELVDLVKTAYSNTKKGSLVQSLQDVIPSDWNVLGWDPDPDIDSCVFYRKPRPMENWIGYKIQGIGHDGTRTSKDKAIEKLLSLLLINGVWIESSDALRHVLKKLNVEPITDERFLQVLFDDPDLKMISNDTYKRNLTTGETVYETVFGKPTLRNKNGSDI